MDLNRINPYQSSNREQSPESTVGVERTNRIRCVGWCVVFGYPLVAIVSVYTVWLVAWMMLGHPPRENLDDPKGIGGIINVFYLLSVLLLVPSPLLVLVGFLMIFVCPFRPKNHPWIFIWGIGALYLLMCGIAYGIIAADPGRVFAWWGD